MFWKTLFAVLSVLIVGEGIYLARLVKELGEVQKKSGPVKTVSVPENRVVGLNQVEQNLPVTARGIENEIKNRLSKWHKEPIEQVIEKCKKKLSENSKDAESHLKLAKIYVYFPEKQKDALKHFQETLALEPNHPEKNYIEFWTSALQPKTNQNLTPRPSRSNIGTPIKTGGTVKEIMDAIEKGRENKVIRVKEPAKPAPNKRETEDNPIEEGIPTKRKPQPIEKKD